MPDHEPEPAAFAAIQVVRTGAEWKSGLQAGPRARLEHLAAAGAEWRELPLELMLDAAPQMS